MDATSIKIEILLVEALNSHNIEFYDLAKKRLRGRVELYRSYDRISAGDDYVQLSTYTHNAGKQELIDLIKRAYELGLIENEYGLQYLCSPVATNNANDNESIKEIPYIKNGILYNAHVVEAFRVLAQQPGTERIYSRVPVLMDVGDADNFPGAHLFKSYKNHISDFGLSWEKGPKCTTLDYEIAYQVARCALPADLVSGLSLNEDQRIGIVHVSELDEIEVNQFSPVQVEAAIAEVQYYFDALLVGIQYYEAVDTEEFDANNFNHHRIRSKLRFGSEHHFLDEKSSNLVKSKFARDELIKMIGVVTENCNLFDVARLYDYYPAKISLANRAQMEYLLNICKNGYKLENVGWVTHEYNFNLSSFELAELIRVGAVIERGLHNMDSYELLKKTIRTPDVTNRAYILARGADEMIKVATTDIQKEFLMKLFPEEGAKLAAHLNKQQKKKLLNSSLDL